MNDWKPYLATLDKYKQKIVIKVMDMAMRTIPSAEKVMNYGVPTLKVDGKPIIAVGANKNHFSVYPYGGSAIEANKALLKDAEFSKGTIRFGYDNLPSQEILDAIVSYKLKY